MYSEIARIHILWNQPLLEVPVHCLLTSKDTIHHCMSLLYCSACQALRFHWRLSNVFIIGLNGFKRFNPCCKKVSKQFKVIEDSGDIRTMNPTDNTNEDAKSNFIPQHRSLVLEKVELPSLVINLEVSSINAEQVIIELVTIETSVQQNL